MAMFNLELSFFLSILLLQILRSEVDLFLGFLSLSLSRDLTLGRGRNFGNDGLLLLLLFFTGEGTVKKISMMRLVAILLGRKRTLFC